MLELLHITTNEQGSLVVSSQDFADGLGIQHKNLLESISTHQTEIEEAFGLIAFETRKTEGRKGRAETVAHLTEDQALLVGTLSRNSKRVVEFKVTLVKSFAEARKRLQPVALTTEQTLLHLVSQQTQLLVDNQQMLAQLRADVDNIMQGNKLPKANTRPPHLNRGGGGKQLSVPGMSPPVTSYRQLIYSRITEYCERQGCSTQQVYTYLYKRLFEVYSIDVYRLAKKNANESLMDMLERYGHLDRIYSLIMAELAIPDDTY